MLDDDRGSLDDRRRGRRRGLRGGGDRRGRRGGRGRRSGGGSGRDDRRGALARRVEMRIAHVATLMTICPDEFELDAARKQVIEIELVLPAHCLATFDHLGLAHRNTFQRCGHDHVEIGTASWLGVLERCGNACLPILADGDSGLAGSPWIGRLGEDQRHDDDNQGEYGNSFGSHCGPPFGEVGVFLGVDRLSIRF